jgi:hypothetical protein
VTGPFLAALAWAAPPPSDHVLSEPGFAFCTEAGRGGPEVLRYCPLLEGLPPDRCPGLRETCARGTPPPAEPPSGCDERRVARRDAIGGEPEAPAAEPPELTLPDWAEQLRSLSRWVMAFLVAGLVLVLLRLLVRSFGRPAPAPPRPAVADPEPEGTPPLEELPAQPVPDVLAAARAALAAGRFDEVVALARGAALKHLHEQGKVVLHRSRTDREYVRATRRAAPDAGEALASIASAREASLFGRRPPDAGVAAAALAAAERIVAAALLLAVLGAEARAADPRYGPYGDAALPALLQAWGHPVSWRLRSLDEVDGSTDVLVLDLVELDATAEQLEHLRAWVEAGGVLWVAGPLDVTFPELGPTVVAECTPEVDPLWASLSTPRSLDEVRVYAEPASPIVWCGEGAAAQVLHLGEGVVVAFADDQWLLNGAFVDPGTERFVGDLLHTGRIVDRWPTDDPARVELATYAATQAPSQGGGNPFRSVANARLLPFVFQLLAAFAVLALWRGWPFAPLRDPARDGRRAFAEHVRALGTRLMRGRASGVAARSLARYWHGRLGTAGLVLAAERAGRTRDEAQALAREVEARATGPGRASGGADHAFMEELWTITRGRTP